MPSASAPGKLILFGEHAVVYGEPAIAVALSDLRIQVDVFTRKDGLIHVHMPDLKPHSAYYKTEAASLSMDESSYQIPPSSKDSERIAQMISASSLMEMSPECLTALIPVVYLINVLLPNLLSTQQGLTIHVTSQSLPSGAGLGSSAALGVACAAALFKLQQNLLSHHSQNHHDDDSVTSSSTTIWTQPSKDELNIINKYSFYSELLIHGTPSGIDNAVSTFGGAIYFQRNVTEDSTQITMDTLSIPSFNIILTNTHVVRSTKSLVAKVRFLKDTFPSIVQPILTSIGAISKQFRDLLYLTTTATENNHNNDIHPSLNESMISNLIQINQHLLCSLGISHPSINRICQETTDLYDTLKCTTKLTGAGGGGCTYTLVERLDGETSHEFETRLHHVQQVIESLSYHNHENTDHKFECFVSSIGNHGVLWC